MAARRFMVMTISATAASVARMERSEMRDRTSEHPRRSPDCAALHPGYEDKTFPSSPPGSTRRSMVKSRMHCATFADAEAPHGLPGHAASRRPGNDEGVHSVPNSTVLQTGYGTHISLSSPPGLIRLCLYPSW